MIVNWLKSLFSQKVALKEQQSFHLITCQIHGSHYYNCLTLVEEKAICNGDIIILQREPHNEYDEYAIEVFNASKIKLGYLPKNHNRVIAELMDQGCSITAIVQTVQQESWEPVAINVTLTV